MKTGPVWLILAICMLGYCTANVGRVLDPYLHCREPDKIKRSTCTPTSPKIPHEKSCGCYIGCPSGYYKGMRCDEGYLFDRRSLSCRPARYVNCADSVAPTTTPPRNQLVLRCPSTTGLFPHPTDCRLYLNCIHGVPGVVQCLSGKVFSRVLRNCVHPSQGDCDPSAQKNKGNQRWGG